MIPLIVFCDKEERECLKESVFIDLLRCSLLIFNVEIGNMNMQFNCNSDIDDILIILMNNKTDYKKCYFISKGLMFFGLCFYRYSNSHGSSRFIH